MLVYKTDSSGNVSFHDVPKDKVVPPYVAMDEAHHQKVLDAHYRGADIKFRNGAVVAVDHKGNIVNLNGPHPAEGYAAPPTIQQLATEARADALNHVHRQFFLMGRAIPSEWTQYMNALEQIELGKIIPSTLPNRPN